MIHCTIHVFIFISQITKLFFLSAISPLLKSVQGKPAVKQDHVRTLAYAPVGVVGTAWGEHFNFFAAR